MKRKKWCFLLLFTFLWTSSNITGQGTHPPEPLMSTTEESTIAPCGSGDGGDGSGIPPPVGLCLPINKYLFPLFISGVALGAFSLFNIQKRVNTTSVL